MIQKSLNTNNFNENVIQLTVVLTERSDDARD